MDHAVLSSGYTKPFSVWENLESMTIPESTNSSDTDPTIGNRISQDSEQVRLQAVIRDVLAKTIRSDDQLIDYSELALRMRISERFARKLKNARIIRPVLEMGKTVRFHWPSVLIQLQEPKSKR